VFFSVQAGVRESIALTYELEGIWKSSTAAGSSSLVDVGHLNNYTLYRYVGTRDGVYRVYPAVRVPLKFDPTTQPQWVPLQTFLCVYRHSAEATWLDLTWFYSSWSTVNFPATSQTLDFFAFPRLFRYTTADVNGQPSSNCATVASFCSHWSSDFISSTWLSHTTVSLLLVV